MFTPEYLASGTISKQDLQKAVGGSGNNPASDPASQPLVINRLDRAQCSAQSLKAIIEVLYQRLHPVLSDSKAAGSDSEKNPSYSVPLAASLNELGDSIEQSVASIEYILSCLEV